MSKYKVMIVGMLLFIISTGIYPILNGIGCNAVFDVDGSLVSVSGRCEKGRLEATFINKDTHDVYSMSGRFAIVGSQFFIFVNEFEFLEKSKVVENDLKRYKYHRDIVSGKLLHDRFILMYTPHANVVETKLTGRMSFW